MSNEEESQFDDLAQELNSDERKELLTKISDNADVNSNEFPKLHYNNSYDITNSLSDTDRDAFNKEELSKLSFLERLIIQLKIIFLQQNINTIMLKQNLTKIRTRLEAKSNWINFDKKTLSVRFAKEIFILFKLVSPLRPILAKIWNDPQTLEMLIDDFIGTNNSLQTSRSIEDFASMDQMLNAYLVRLDMTDMRKVIVRNIKNYIDSIPQGTFKEIKHTLTPFYNLQKLATFPFEALLTLMGASTSALHNNIDGPVFNTTPVSIVLEHLLKLTHTLALIENVSFNSGNASQIILRRYFLSEGLNSEEADHQADIKLKNLQQLSSFIISFNSKISLIDVLRYFQNDPFFNLVITPPFFDVQKFYLNALKLVVNDNFKATSEKVRLAFINYSIDQMFSNSDLSPLSYYVVFNTADWQKLKLPVFKYTHSLMLLYNFLKEWYKKNISPLVSTLNSHVLIKMPILQNKLNEFKNALDNGDDKIHRFDLSLMPESEAGKHLAFLRASMRENTAQLRTLSNFMRQKDEEAYRIITETVSDLTNFIIFIKSKIEENTFENIRTALASVYPNLTSNLSLSELLTQKCTVMQNFTQMIKEMINSERTNETVA
jgi:hypothetical protein